MDINQFASTFGRAKFCSFYFTVCGQAPVTQKSRELCGPEKPFVKVRPAYSVKLVFSYVVKGIKTKITANFRASRRLRFEDTKRTMSPEIRPKSFGTWETGPRPQHHGSPPTLLVWDLWLNFRTELVNTAGLWDRANGSYYLSKKAWKSYICRWHYISSDLAIANPSYLKELTCTVHFSLLKLGMLL